MGKWCSMLPIHARQTETKDCFALLNPDELKKLIMEKNTPTMSQYGLSWYYSLDKQWVCIDDSAERKCMKVFVPFDEFIEAHTAGTVRGSKWEMVACLTYQALGFQTLEKDKENRRMFCVPPQVETLRCPDHSPISYLCPFHRLEGVTHWRKQC